jgi:hypothetical protein
MSEKLEVIAARIARIAMGEVPSIGKIGPGPVVTVVRDTLSRKIYVGLNTGVPPKLADAMFKGILAQKARIWQGEVVLVHTDPTAIGGHSEVTALNKAIFDHERLLGRKMKEIDLGVFELHNVWIRGDRANTAAPRCEHCARITRGVTVTEAMFVAEGGVMGEINLPQRGAVTLAGSRISKPVTTASGSIHSLGESGDDEMSGAVGAWLEGLLVITTPLIKQWFAKKYLQEKWSAAEREMVQRAIAAFAWPFNVLITSRRLDILQAKAAGQQVKLHVVVDTEWIDTDFGPAQIKAEVSSYTLLFPGETAIEWPLFQPHYGFWAALLKAAQITHRRAAYDFVL